MFHSILWCWDQEISLILGQSQKIWEIVSLGAGLRFPISHHWQEGSWFWMKCATIALWYKVCAVKLKMKLLKLFLNFEILKILKRLQSVSGSTLLSCVSATRFLSPYPETTIGLKLSMILLIFTLPLTIFLKKVRIGVHTLSLFIANFLITFLCTDLR